MPFRFIARLAFLFAAFLALEQAAADVVILAPRTDQARSVAEKIKSRIDVPARIAGSLEETGKAELVVAVGNALFSSALTQTRAPVIGVFINRFEYESDSLHQPPPVVIYSDPSPQDIADFLSKHFPRSKIGYLYSLNEAKLVSVISDVVSQSGSRLVTINHQGDIFAEIRALARGGVDIMFISKNRSIYKPDTIRFALEFFFRKNIPVVTTSPSLVEVGATIAISATDEQIVEATSAAVRRVLAGENSTDVPLHRNAELEVKVNPVMAEYFNLQIESSSQ